MSSYFSFIFDYFSHRFNIGEGGVTLGARSSKSHVAAKCISDTLNIGDSS
ncbi:protein of unknown function [Streptococcus thermophilus]|nr:protein of unknown function [Streptococcus thermophilus]